MNVKDNMVC